jgi:hypothetical protein
MRMRHCVMMPFTFDNLFAMGVRGCDRGASEERRYALHFRSFDGIDVPNRKVPNHQNKRLDDGISSPQRLGSRSFVHGRGQNPESRRNENGRWLLPPSDEILTLHPHYHPRHSACPGVSTPIFSMFGTCEIMSLLTSCPFDVLGDKHNTLRRILRACTAPSRVTSRRQQS